VTTQHGCGTQVIELFGVCTAQSVTCYTAAHFGRGAVEVRYCTHMDSTGTCSFVWRSNGGKGRGRWRIWQVGSRTVPVMYVAKTDGNGVYSVLSLVTHWCSRHKGCQSARWPDLATSPNEGRKVIRVDLPLYSRESSKSCPCQYRLIPTTSLSCGKLCPMLRLAYFCPDFVRSNEQFPGEIARKRLHEAEFFLTPSS
jgi:hypothetical protein